MKPQTGVGHRPKENAPEGPAARRGFLLYMKEEYTQGQPQYTLLKKEKINQKTGDIIIQYDRLTPEEIKKNKAKKEHEHPHSISIIVSVSPAVFLPSPERSAPQILSTFCLAVW